MSLHSQHRGRRRPTRAVRTVTSVEAASYRPTKTLYDLTWSVRSAAVDSSGYVDDDVERGLLRPFQHLLPQAIESMTQRDARRYWLILSADEPIACVDTEGRLLRPEAADGFDFSAEADDLSLAYALATELVSVRVQHQLASGVPAPVRPGLGLASVLSAFNRKERFFVTTQAAGLLTSAEMHGPSIPLAAPIRRRLSATLGVDVPAHSYAAVDYHLSWLHAALAWWRGDAWPHQDGDWPKTTGVAESILVDGSQQDVDLLVCWADADGEHIVGVEAKAYGAWSNKPIASKVARLAGIASECQATDVDIRFVLTSRRPPQGLAPPEHHWATGRDGGWAWMPLSAPGLRLSTTRCDLNGHPSASGTTWRIAGPNGR